MKQCAECETTLNIHKHHVFGGPNRKISEKYGFIEYFCMMDHTGPNGIHFNKAIDLRYKQKHQSIYEQTHSREEWLKLIGRNYL